MNDNPFSIIFGIEPTRFISRESQISEIVDTFKSNTPSSYLYIITGVRGSGKTVTMASIINRLKNEKGWITITLNSNRDLLTGLAANLYEHPLLKPAFLKANISFSLGINAIANNYSDVFNISNDEALQMAKFTMGYSYAFQVSGYLKFKRQVPFEALIPEFDEIVLSWICIMSSAKLDNESRDIVILGPCSGQHFKTYHFPTKSLPKTYFFSKNVSSAVDLYRPVSKFSSSFSTHLINILGEFAATGIHLTKA